MEYVKKLIDKRELHKREYDSRVNERQMKTTEEKVDASKALDASLVITECSRTNMEKKDTSSTLGNDAHVDDAYIRPIYDEEPMAEVQFETNMEKKDTSSTLGNDAHVDDAYIRPVYDEEPMAEVQLSADHNVFATGQQHTENPEFNNEREVDQNAEQYNDIRPLPAK
nr:hypothetical protein [Tanacetum cinerariifolium]